MPPSSARKIPSIEGLDGKDRMVQGTDVFIIGGGPAGLAAALAARKKGFNVMVADGARPPIDKACGEGLMPEGLGALRELGVDIEASQGFAFRGVRFLQNGSAVEANFPAGTGIGLRRWVLHQKMVEQARKAGVSFLWQTPITGLCAEGVVLGGTVVTARWIVGADGIRSQVRKWAELDTPAHKGIRFAFRRHYRVRPWSEHMEVYWGRNMQAYVTPVAKQEVCAVLLSRLQGQRFACLRGEFPELAERLGPEAGAERGAITVVRQLERVYRGRVALIGDASGSVDAVTGEGLSLSFRQAAALAEALEAGELRQYQEVHRRLALRPAIMGRLILLLAGHERLRERTIRALASDAGIFARLLAVHVGTGSPLRLAVTGARFGWGLVTA
jgi:flavin-dependent dehydrogenase